MTAKRPPRPAWWDTIGGRRFALTVGCGVVYTGLLIGRYLTGAEYVTLQIATVAAFIVANTVQKTRGAGDA